MCEVIGLLRGVICGNCYYLLENDGVYFLLNKVYKFFVLEVFIYEGLNKNNFFITNNIYGVL